MINSNHSNDVKEINDNFKKILSTETLSYKTFISIYNELYNVKINYKEMSIFVVGITISKQNKILDLNRMIKYFSNFKNKFTLLEKEITWY